MGFLDKSKNEQVLKQTKGNVNDAVAVLISATTSGGGGGSASHPGVAAAGRNRPPASADAALQQIADLEAYIAKLETQHAHDLKQIDTHRKDASAQRQAVDSYLDQVGALQAQAAQAAQAAQLQHENTALKDGLAASESAVACLTRRAARQWTIPEEDIDLSSDVYGRGAFGVVKKARWNGMDVAVKCIPEHAQAADIEKAKKLLKNEARTLSFVKHANIVRFYGACTEPPMVVMMAAPNGTLRDLLDASPNLSAVDRFYIARGICSGMAALHAQNILHLDLKPTNVVLDAEITPMIADFGLALMEGGSL